MGDRTVDETKAMAPPRSEFERYVRQQIRPTPGLKLIKAGEALKDDQGVEGVKATVEGLNCGPVNVSIERTGRYDADDIEYFELIVDGQNIEPTTNEVLAASPRSHDLGKAIVTNVIDAAPA